MHHIYTRTCGAGSWAGGCKKKETLLQHRVKCEMGGVSEGSSRRVPGGGGGGVGLRVRTKMALQMEAETFDALYIDRLTMNIIIQRLWQHSINSLQRRTSNVTIAWVLEVAPGS